MRSGSLYLSNLTWELESKMFMHEKWLHFLFHSAKKGYINYYIFILTWYQTSTKTTLYLNPKNYFFSKWLQKVNEFSRIHHFQIKCIYSWTAIGQELLLLQKILHTTLTLALHQLWKIHNRHLKSWGYLQKSAYMCTLVTDSHLKSNLSARLKTLTFSLLFQGDFVTTQQKIYYWKSLNSKKKFLCSSK